MTEEKKIICKKLGEELPALNEPPFPGDIGQEIFENISAKAWSMWADDMQIKVLNEYRLNMGDPEDYKSLIEQMMLFLNLQDGEVAEVENAERGRGEAK
ncbi:MAG: oxidative damage protection protein [Bdellovibrionota bacterium]